MLRRRQLETAVVDAFNEEFAGDTAEALLFPSESRTHFMSGPTFMTLLHNLIGPAFERKRGELGLGREARGLLLVDGWSGFHCTRSGLSAARSAWSIQFNVQLPAEQVLEWTCFHWAQVNQIDLTSFFL